MTVKCVNMYMLPVQFLKCPECSFMTIKTAVFLNHMRDEHHHLKTVSLYTCPECSSLYSAKNCLVEHLEIHHQCKDVDAMRLVEKLISVDEDFIENPVEKLVNSDSKSPSANNTNCGSRRRKAANPERLKLKQEEDNSSEPETKRQCVDKGKNSKPITVTSLEGVLVTTSGGDSSHLIFPNSGGENTQNNPILSLLAQIMKNPNAANGLSLTIDSSANSATSAVSTGQSSDPSNTGIHLKKDLNTSTDSQEDEALDMSVRSSSSEKRSDEHLSSPDSAVIGQTSKINAQQQQSLRLTVMPVPSKSNNSKPDSIVFSNLASSHNVPQTTGIDVAQLQAIIQALSQQQNNLSCSSESPNTNGANGILKLDSLVPQMLLQQPHNPSTNSLLNGTGLSTTIDQQLLNHFTSSAQNNLIHSAHHFATAKSDSVSMMNQGLLFQRPQNTLTATNGLNLQNGINIGGTKSMPQVNFLSPVNSNSTPNSLSSVSLGVTGALDFNEALLKLQQSNAIMKPSNSSLTLNGNSATEPSLLGYQLNPPPNAVEISGPNNEAILGINAPEFKINGTSLISYADIGDHPDNYNKNSSTPHRKSSKPRKSGKKISASPGKSPNVVSNEEGVSADTDNYNTSSSGLSFGGGSKPHRQNFNQEQNRLLNNWFEKNKTKPYPSTEETTELASLTHLSYNQVKKWFANKRARSGKDIPSPPCGDALMQDESGHDMMDLSTTFRLGGLPTTVTPTKLAPGRPPNNSRGNGLTMVSFPSTDSGIAIVEPSAPEDESDLNLNAKLSPEQQSDSEIASDSSPAQFPNPSHDNEESFPIKSNNMV